VVSASVVNVSVLLDLLDLLVKKLYNVPLIAKKMVFVFMVLAIVLLGGPAKSVLNVKV
jgi:hypothetical protein